MGNIEKISETMRNSGRSIYICGVKYYILACSTIGSSAINLLDGVIGKIVITDNPYDTESGMVHLVKNFTMCNSFHKKILEMEGLNKFTPREFAKITKEFDILATKYICDEINNIYVKF